MVEFLLAITWSDTKTSVQMTGEMSSHMEHKVSDSLDLRIISRYSV